MTATIADLRTLCNSIKGKTENPPNSNRIFVWTDLIRAKIAAAWLNGQPYCAGGREWLLWKLKIKRPDLSNPWYVPSRIQWARAHGRWVPVHQGKAGDEVMFAFTASAKRSGLGEHVETLMQDVKPGDTTIRTFGFNTSSGSAGSQDNGGGCFFRTRPIDDTVLGVLRYHDQFAHDATPVAQKPLRPNPFAKALRAAKLPILKGAGMHSPDGDDAVRGIQWAIGIPVDGRFGDDTDHALRHFQRYHVDSHGQGLIPDGEAGRLTVGALLRVRHP